MRSPTVTTSTSPSTPTLGELDEWHVPVRSFAGAEETYDDGHTHATDEMSMETTG